MRLIARAMSVLAGATLVFALFGSSVAAADPLAGDSYGDASSKIDGWGGKAVISSVTGSGLPTDECIVTSSQQSMFLNSSGTNSRQGEFRLNLNCNRKLASAGHPGNSAASPEGKEAQKDEANAVYIEKHHEICEKNEDNANWCVKLCERTGLCTFGQ